MATSLIRGRLETRPELDWIWLLCFLSALIIFIYLTTYGSIDNGLASRGAIGFMILIAGVVGNLALTGFRSDRFFTIQEIVGASGGVLVSLAVIGFVNVLGQRVQLSSLPISNALFAMLIGIAEEQFFRGFVLTLTAKMTGNSFVGVLVSSGVGAVYHAAVYGVSNNLIFIVFGSFVVLGFVYVASGYRLSVPMAAHAIVNLLAYLG